jgi:hypothetical protein
MPILKRKNEIITVIIESGGSGRAAVPVFLVVARTRV